MKPISADSGPLIGLSRINELGLLTQLFHSVLIPPAVAKELFPKGKRKKGVAALRAATWLKTQALQDPSSLKAVSADLGPGERAALALAYESSYPLLIDDKAARQEAERLGIEIYGTLGVLLEAKTAGLIPEIKPFVEALIRENYWLSPQLVEEVLQQAREAEKEE